MKLDLLIIGGGPAGAAAAITAAHIGWRVALVERTTYDDVRIGETFAPPSNDCQISAGTT